MNRWLDTETKAFLQQLPPLKLAPANTETFSIVVLREESEPISDRCVRAFERILRTTRIEAESQTTKTPPFVVRRALALTDAILAQFELVCCDIVSVFLADPVASDAEPAYLADLYHLLTQSDEFARVTVLVNWIPPDEAGDEFVDQFIGTRAAQMPYRMMTTRKKARIMDHWAKKIGGDVVNLD
jgi:hypothetical protein